ncbi:MAG: protein kinase [Planctomycetia bacterium]|nr:protein kinase [Planctomycetia bacterium]
MPVATSNQFLETLRKSGLVEDSILDASLSSYTGTTEDPTKIAEYLVKNKLITTFQARSLLAGRYRGLVIGAYRVMEKIGSGGMGIVYMAEHEKLKRRVAIKILPEDKTRDKLALERFYREARAAAALDHPNVVKAFDVSEHQGMHYLVMEYIDGTNLQKYLDTKGPLPWKTALNIVVQACKGLQHAHERNMVHRDIKPANILVDKGGQVKILDLGLARSFQISQDNLTQDLSDGKDIMGSIDYIAPEQAIANNMVDIRADIYSLGATLYSLITGKPPVEGTTAQKLLQHQMQMPTPVSRLNPEVPEGVSHIINKMMAKRPEHRFSVPSEVASALSPFISNTSQPISGVNSYPMNPNLAGPPSGMALGLHSGNLGSGNLASGSLTSGNLGRSTGSLQPTVPIMGNSQSIASHSTKIEAKGQTTRLKVATKNIKLDKKLSTKTIIIVAVLAAILIPGLTIFLITSGGRKAPVEIDPSMRFTMKGETLSFSAGSRVPELAITDFDNNTFKLKDYAGKVIIFQFWGFWDPHSLKMFREFNDIYKKYQDRNVVIVGVNTDISKEEIDQGMRNNEVPGRNVRSTQPDKTSLARFFGVKGSPTVFIIDGKGVFRHVWEGEPSMELFEKHLQKYVEEAAADELLKQHQQQAQPAKK